VDHATRFGLTFDTLSGEWGNGFDNEAVRRAVDRTRPEWMWFVHCETSTGVLNDLEMLKSISAEREIRLCADCISSVGTVSVDLQGVSFASCVSGKGLASYPGLAMVFHNDDELPISRALPRYLDLGLFAASQGVPFTVSSNLVYALKVALEQRKAGETTDAIAQLSAWARQRLRELGFCTLGQDHEVSPAVITIACPPTTNSGCLGRKLEEAGYALSYRSLYLLQRNYLQICLMGEVSRGEVGNLLDELEKYTFGLDRSHQGESLPQAPPLLPATP
jgi:aspartate aminotransferase-like enzyme